MALSLCSARCWFNWWCQPEPQQVRWQAVSKTMYLWKEGTLNAFKLVDPKRHHVDGEEGPVLGGVIVFNERGLMVGHNVSVCLFVRAAMASTAPAGTLVGRNRWAGTLFVSLPVALLAANKQRVVFLSSSGGIFGFDDLPCHRNVR